VNHDEHLRALVRYGYGIEDCRAAGCEGRETGGTAMTADPRATAQDG
jgi:hypothetical protein